MIRVIKKDLGIFFRRQRRSFLLMLTCFSISIFIFCYFYSFYSGIRAQGQSRGAFVLTDMEFGFSDHGMPAMTHEREARLRAFLEQEGFPELINIRYGGNTQAQRYEGELLEGDEWEPLTAYAAPFVYGLEPGDHFEEGLVFSIDPDDNVLILVDGRWLEPEDNGLKRALVGWPMATGYTAGEILGLEKFYERDEDGQNARVKMEDIEPLDTVRMQNDEEAYEVVGLVDGMSYNGEYYMVLPRQTYLDAEIPTNKVTLVTHKALSTAQKQKLVQFTHEWTPGFSAEISAKRGENIARANNEYLYRLISSASLAFLAVLN
ncbi:MAG: hypothetical protein ACOX88_05195 [Christensenellales bacterium]|jgi:hypothetical protein